MLEMFLDAMQWDKSWNIIAPSIGKTALIYCTHTTLVEREREDGHSAKKLDFWSCRRGAEYVINKCIYFCSFKFVQNVCSKKRNIVLFIGSAGDLKTKCQPTFVSIQNEERPGCLFSFQILTKKTLADICCLVFGF